MTRRKKEPLRPLSTKEREVLERMSRAQSDPASHMARDPLAQAAGPGRAESRKT